MIDESDQAGIIYDVIGDHLLLHNGVPKIGCPLCDFFNLNNPPKETGLMSARFIIFDVSDENYKYEE